MVTLWPYVDCRIADLESCFSGLAANYRIVKVQVIRLTAWP